MMREAWYVWMSSSLRAARRIAQAIVEDLRSGEGGFCGTMFGKPPPQAIYGAWIYRVKPTGPIRRDGRSHWITSFPVRVLEIADVFAEPEKNNLTLPAIRTLWDFAAEVFCAYARHWRLCPSEAERQSFCRKWMEEIGAELKKELRQQHHKLTPDPRYKRDQSWKRDLDE
jgi:hypothetical protein